MSVGEFKRALGIRGVGNSGNWGVTKLNEYICLLYLTPTKNFYGRILRRLADVGGDGDGGDGGVSEGGGQNDE